MSWTLFGSPLSGGSAAFATSGSRITKADPSTHKSSRPSMPTGPKGQRRPADVIGNAIRVAQIATGEVEEEYVAKPEKNEAAAEAGRKGGAARAKAMTGPLICGNRNDAALDARSAKLGHRLISAHPDSCGCEFDECEIVGGVLLVPGGDGSEVLELVEEALDAVPRSVQEGAEGGFVEPAGQRLDVGEDAPCRHVLAEKVAVVGAVGDQDLAGAEALKHIGGAPAVVSLSLGQLQGDR